MTNREKVLSHFNSMRKKAIELWGYKGVDLALTSFKYNLGSTRVLGLCVTNRITGLHIIRLNEDVLNAATDEYIKEVVTHEICHAIVAELYPDKMNGNKIVSSHGKEFKRVCSHFGISGKASVTGFDKFLPKAKDSVRYTCSCNEYFLTKRQHNRFQTGKSSFVCNSCKETLIHDDSTEAELDCAAILTKKSYRIIG